MHLWEKAKEVKLQTGPEIVGGFSLGCDKRIPEETKQILIDFAYWVEDNYNIPITLWVDFKYNHYLVTRTKKRVGYRFYWVDFDTYPVFEKEADIPVIELPVRTEHSTVEEILASFIEAISCYFAWITNQMEEGYQPDLEQVEEILQAYLQFQEENL
ncbi:MAG: hypothetical protein IKB09_00310 [Oscillospiraceae bacterium]|nr:hypothetical protein [Oscillospiraceae bacterium]